MLKRISIAFVCAFLAVAAHAQTPPTLPDPMACIGFFSELGDAQAIGGGAGPEDVAYNAVTNRVYILHDFPNSSPDILLEYELDGTLVAASRPPAVIGGGLCAMPNGHLLLGNGLSIVELDTAGVPVAGGISATLAVPTGIGFVGIQDLDYYQGFVYCHDGNNGTVLKYDSTTNTSTVIFSDVTRQSQALAIHPVTGDIWIAKPFFQSGSPLSNGTIRVFSQTGTELYLGNSPIAPRLRRDEDLLCNPAPGNFSVPNGFAFMPNGDLWVSNFNSFGSPTANIGRFRPQSLGAAIRLTNPTCIGSASLPAVQIVTGEPRYGAGFTAGFINGTSGLSSAWAVSLGRDCGGTISFGTGCTSGVDISQLILPDFNTGLGFFNVGPNGDFSIFVDLSTYAGPAFEVYSQWLLIDAGVPSGATTTNLWRIKFGP